MERIIIGMEGFECVNSDLCATISGGKGGLKRLWRTICENVEDFILGFIEGYTGKELNYQS